MRPSTAARLVTLALAGTLAGCGGGGTAEPARPSTSLFDYDPSAPLRFRDEGVANRGYPIPIHDVSYASPRGGRVTAYLVVPPTPGRHPAILYLHGSGGTLQNGTADTIVPRRALRALAAAGSHPKRIRWYPGAGHGLSTRAYRDQIAWLARRLGLGGVVVRGADGGP